MQSLPPANQMVFVSQYKGLSKFPPKAELNWVFIASDFLSLFHNQLLFYKRKTLFHFNH